MADCETELCVLDPFPPEPSPYFLSSFSPFASPPAEAGGPPSTPRPPPHSPPHSPNPPPPPPRRSSSLSPSPSPSSLSNGAVVGIVIGGVAAVVLLVLVLAFLYFWFTKKRRGADDHNADDQNLPPPGPIIGDQYKREQMYPAPAEKYMMARPSPPTMLSLNHSPKPPRASIGMSSSSGSNYSGSEDPARTPFHGMALSSSKNMFTYEVLHMATDGFSAANFLGEGGFGHVHKGVLPNGKEVAVKSLKLGGVQGEREFQAEVDIISRVHHRHLVSLVGYCKGCVIAGMGQPTMDWPTRLKVALGSAKGLAYLHEDCHPRIIHRDIKAANILLDFLFDSKVADFGLARVCPDAYTHVTTRVMGTFGYLAPEYASTGKLTEKSDVYSFGVLLLELITGHRPVGSRHSYMDYSLVDWATPLLAEALEDNKFDSLVDQRLQNSYSLNEMIRVIACAASCVRYSAYHRPQMSMVARVLEGEVSLADLDKGMKAGQSPVLGPQRSSDSESGERGKLQKMAFGTKQGEQGSSEYGATASENDAYTSGSSSSYGIDMGKIKER